MILERCSEATYRVLRYERSRRKRVTINVSHLRPRHSHHVCDNQAHADLDITQQGYPATPQTTRRQQTLPTEASQKTMQDEYDQLPLPNEVHDQGHLPTDANHPPLPTEAKNSTNDVQHGTRRSTRLRHQPTHFGHRASDQDMDHLISAIQTTKSIAHLLPSFAHLPPHLRHTYRFHGHNLDDSHSQEHYAD